VACLEDIDDFACVKMYLLADFRSRRVCGTQGRLRHLVIRVRQPQNFLRSCSRLVGDVGERHIVPGCQMPLRKKLRVRTEYLDITAPQ